MDIRKIGKMKDKVKYVTLPPDWCEPGEYVNIETIDDKTLKITKVESNEDL